MAKTFRTIAPAERRTMNLIDGRRTRHEWATIVDAMNDPSFELDAEEFAEILRALTAMEQAGVELDPGLKALALVLARQMIGTDADSDHDDSDQFIDLDDSDVDGSDELLDREDSDEDATDEALDHEESASAENYTRFVDVEDVGSGRIGASKPPRFDGSVSSLGDELKRLSDEKKIPPQVASAAGDIIRRKPRVLPLWVEDDIKKKSLPLHNGVGSRELTVEEFMAALVSANESGK